MNELTVLVVHPEPAVAARLGEALRRAGHEPIVVPDGERAIDRFIQSPTDALIVEMVLPGRDGTTTAESIRWAPGGDRCAVILLTSRGNAADVQEAERRINAIATLDGPVDTKAIIELLLDVNDARRASTRVGLQPKANSQGGGKDEVWTDATTRPGEAKKLLLDASPTKGPGRAGRRGWDDELYTDVDDELTGDWSHGDDPEAETEGRDVDRRSERAATEADVLEGNLERTPFPRLLTLLAEQRESGALYLTSEHDGRRTTTDEVPKKAVYFRAGVPRYVQSNLVQECLGQVLARGGTISHAVLTESVERMRRGEGRQGAVLLAMGAITPHQLRDALEDQLKVKLFDLFAWSTGRYHFRKAEPTPREMVTLEMSLPEIVYRGVVHRIPPQRLLDVLSPSFDSFVVPDRLRLGRFLRVDMPPESKAILHALDGTARLSELLTNAGDRPGAIAQVVYALHCADAVRFQRAPDKTAPLTEKDARDTSSLTRDVSVLREELRRLGRLLREERWGDALGVREGDAEAAAEAADKLRRRFHPITEPGAAPRDLRALAFEVCARLVHAKEALTAPPGSRRDPLKLSQSAFDDEEPTSDQKKKKRKRRGPRKRAAEIEPDERIDASPSESPPSGGRTTMPDTPRAKQDVSEAAVELSRRSSPPPRPRVGEGVGTMSEGETTAQPLLPESRGEALLRHAPFANPLDHGEEPSTLDVSSDEVSGDAPSSKGVALRATAREDFETFDEDSTIDSVSDELFAIDDELLALAEGRIPETTVNEDTSGDGDGAGDGDGGGDGALPESTVPEDAVAASPLDDLDAQVERLYQAERHFRRGERALGRQRFADAVVAFERAVELCPDEGEFLSHLGYARYQIGDAALRTQAIEELRRGAELAPKLDITHVLRARVLVDRGDVVNARDAFGQALAANPDCREALAGLNALSGR